MTSYIRIFSIAFSLLAIYLGFNNEAYAQCSGGTSIGSITPAAAWSTVCIQGGQYVTFNATQGRMYTFSFCKGGGSAPTWDDTQITILDNAGTTTVDFNDDVCGPNGYTAELVFTATATATYRVLVTKWWCGTDPVCQNMAYQTTIPPNDNICTAKYLYSNRCACSYTTYTTDLSTNSTTTLSPACSGIGKDVWFATKVPSSGKLNIGTQAGQITDGVMAVYKGSCSGALTQLSCVDDVGGVKMPSMNLTGLTPGDSLFIRFWGRTAPQKGTFGLCLFDPTPYYCMVGNAGELNPGNCLQISPDGSGNPPSAVWNTTKLNLSSSFDYTFSVNLGTKDANGADGVAFVMQNNPAGYSAVGIGGFGLGVDGLNNSFAVEFDTWNNGGGADDIPEDHISIDINGDVANAAAGPIQASATSGNIEDGLNHTVRITWNSTTKDFQVYFDGSSRLSYTNDVVNTIFGGNPNVYWGFTASTGLYYNSQVVCPGNLPGAAPPLPVTWASFNVDLLDGKALISWSTANETNNQEFIIERSSDGVKFLPIGNVSARGNTNNASNYQFLDPTPLIGDSYYRIYQIDIDGKTSYSSIRNLNNSNTFSLRNFCKIYPNPANPESTINADLQKDAALEVYDNLGNLVIKESLNKGSNALNILGGYLQNGIYHFVLRSEDDVQFITLVVVQR